MSLFDILKYPVSNPMTNAEIMNLPDDIASYIVRRLQNECVREYGKPWDREDVSRIAREELLKRDT